MSQHDFDLANAAGASFRSDANAALQALASVSSGATAPSTAYAYQFWADTTTNTLKQRNAANSAWIVRGTLDETLGLSRSSNTMLDISDRGKLIRATASFTQTLDAAATLGDGWFCFYRIESGAAIVFDPNASETIDGATTKGVTGGAGGVGGVLYCDGTSLYTVGFPGGIPQTSKSAAYTTVLADANTHLLHPSADTTARTFTIDSNANVAYPIGTALTFINQNGAGVLTISITTDTMRLAGAGTTGSRTLAANGIATAIKITSTEWIISGTGLT